MATDTITKPLQTLTEITLHCLYNDDLYEIAAEIYADVFANYSRFLRDQDYTLLYNILQSPWGRERYSNLQAGDFEDESIQYGRLLLAYGDSKVQTLAETATVKPESIQIIADLTGLLAAKGAAVHEDKIFATALEFWSFFMLALTNAVYTSEDKRPEWVDAATPCAMAVVERCWEKIQFPPSTVFRTWDSDDQQMFTEARRDVADLLQQVYLITGASLYSVFMNVLLRVTQNQDSGSEMEAALFCVSQLSECVSNNDEDEYLDHIFGSGLLTIFAAQGSQVPIRTRRSLLTLIDCYSGTGYFQRTSGSRFLPQVLTFMVDMMGSANQDLAAANSIYNLCASCRQILVPEINAFIAQYRQLGALHIDATAKEKFVGAVACIIQAMPDDASKVMPLQSILNLIEEEHQMRTTQIHEASTAKLLSDDESHAKSLELAAHGLRCLADIGMASRVPSDTPINLDGDEITTFWLTGEGAAFQQRVVHFILNCCNTYPSEGIIIEEACNIFRTGFTEHEAGPFVFAPEVVADFLLRFNIESSRIGHVMKTACIFVGAQAHADRKAPVVKALLLWVVGILEQQGGMFINSIAITK